MNIITNADVNVFLKLLKAGLRNGRQKDLKNYNSATCYDGTDVPKEFYCHLEFTFKIDADKIDELFIDDDAGLTNQIDELLNNRQP